MDNTLLRDVIEVEKEIQQSIDATKQRMHQWLVARKQEVEDTLARQEQELDGDYRGSCERIKEEAERQASLMLEQARRDSDGIAGAKNDIIAAVVSRYIGRIVPEKP